MHVSVVRPVCVSVCLVHPVCLGVVVRPVCVSVWWYVLPGRTCENVYSCSTHVLTGAVSKHSVSASLTFIKCMLICSLWLPIDYISYDH